MDYYTFNDALFEVRNEMLRLQVRIDEYEKPVVIGHHEWNAALRERGAIRRASLDLSAALVKLRKVKL